MRRDVDVDQALAEREAVEALQRRSPSPKAGRGERTLAGSTTSRPGGEIADDGLGGPRPGVAGAAHIAFEVAQIGAIGPDRRGGEPPLDMEVGEVILDRPVKVHAGRSPPAATGPGRNDSARSSSSRAEA